MNLNRRTGLAFAILVVAALLIGARYQDSQEQENKQEPSQSAASQKSGSDQTNGGQSENSQNENSQSANSQNDNGGSEEVKGDPAKGKDLFEGNCSICHEVTDEDKIGPGLKGIFQKGPHQLSDGTEVKKVTVEFVRKQIMQGGGTMPPVGTTNSLSEQDVNDIIVYLKTL